MAELSKSTFDYPIPGQGMTAEVGSRPWQNPPQYTTVEEALEFYIPVLFPMTYMTPCLTVWS